MSISSYHSLPTMQEMISDETTSAMMINKAEGQTLIHNGIYLSSPVFSPWPALCDIFLDFLI